ncbi:MAG: hypothetical protein HY894_00365 [Deltaproteobacteria bacterium]|nr:hypothetical protein [Deltaproteobacteria bacterium]
MLDNKKEKARKNLLAALFVKAGNHGIEADELREDIAPTVIGKRLSEASAREIVRVIEHVAKLYQTPSPSSPLMGEAGTPLPREAHCNGEREGEFKRYPSSRPGLIEELKDVARARWGADFEKPLNEFVNHNRPVKTHYKFLDVTTLKGIKERIKELNATEVQ